MTVLRVTDDGTWTAVRLVTDVWKREPARPFTRIGAGWELALPPLPVDRLEYLLEVERADGTSERLCMPNAPTVAQPFGEKSVLELASYRAPAWVSEVAPTGIVEPLTIPCEQLGGPVTGLLWSAPGLVDSAPAPLIVALDGPEYASFAALDQFLAVAVATSALPPLRAALLAPRARDEDYSASEAFADALAAEIIPSIVQRAPCSTPRLRIGLGASLGGLAMLHAHRRRPQLLDALVLQSGSFFDHELDTHEAGFPWFARISAFVREVVTGPSSRTIPVAITCGTGEENLANNRAMAAALAAQNYPLSFHEVRDAHTWTCWRDAFGPAFAAIAAERAHVSGAQPRYERPQS